ncbi:MAG: ubiquinone/menaquinone biosynthesis methylase-like protein, partial [uncultured bacterium]
MLIYSLIDEKLGRKMKLHLGCGEVHLTDYINIDYPVDQHTVQTKPAADEFHDILELSYPHDSIDEIRLHHVFEHFSRPVALGLLAGWWCWLRPEGILHIEVPDFDRTVLTVLNPFSKQELRGVALRHIFGSQEASWAVHMEGWSPKRLSHLIRSMGYKVNQVNKNSYKGTHNFEIIAVKTSVSFQRDDFEK